MFDPQRTGNRLAQIGAWLQIGFVLCLVALPSMRHLQALRTHGANVFSPLSRLENAALIAGAIGSFAWLAGMILLLITITAFRCRAKWLFAFLIVCGATILIAPPFGTAFGIFFIVFALLKRREFTAKNFPHDTRR